MTIEIYVAAHKPYWMPGDSMYVPLQVGAALAQFPIEGYQSDDAGDSISVLNPRYCELTALYWAWKNSDADYIGLVHYRRHFKGEGENDTLTKSEAERLLEKAPVVLPKRRKYYIETIESHYSHTLDGTHIGLLRESVANLAPDYLSAFDKCMAHRSAHMFNMLLMRKDVLDAYCSWLFPILHDVENRIDFCGMTPFEERAVGRLSERLMDVWITKSMTEYVEQPVVYLGKTNWSRKIASFIAAKFFGKKVQKSF